MDAQVLKRRALQAMVGVGFASLLASLVLLSATMDGGAASPAWVQYTLLVVNAAGVIILIGLITTNLVSLVRQFREHQPGTRLTLRMVGIFSVLALVPVVIVFGFALQSINRSIDSWFDVEVEQALDDALELSRSALDIRGRELLVATERMSARLADTPELFAATELDLMRRESGAEELSLFGGSDRIIAISADELEREMVRPSQAVMLQVRQGRPFVSLDPAAGDSLYFRIVVPVTSQRGLGQQRVLQVLYPVRTRLNDLAGSVQDAYSRYRGLLLKREPLKLNFILTLSLVLLVSLLAALWGALYSARRLVAPIQDLAAGTHKVAAGDLDTQLPIPTSEDEVGFLVASFNEMIKRLSEAREEARGSQKVVEAERAYLETILGRLSTGVIALDGDLRIRAANAASRQILELDVSSHEGQPLMELGEGGPVFDAVVQACREHYGAGGSVWREELVVTGERGRRVIVCSSTALPGEEQGPAGYVLVFDDLTALVQAQRDAAWGEVARRLAHEIKNPLTPIQLSAERIQRRLSAKLEEDDASMLDRSATTIVQQVEAMKAMVDAFGDYARTPELALEVMDLNRLISEVGELYRSRELKVTLQLDLDADMPPIEADPGRVRQMLHNLIGNSLEALSGVEGGGLRVTSRLREHGGSRLAEIVVEDDGPGFETDLIGQVFDPYVSSKPKGTGLGLAIVKKLVEEHAGEISASNREECGARVRISLPADEAARSQMLLSGVRVTAEAMQERGR